jgi:hypothetical protein
MKRRGAKGTIGVAVERPRRDGAALSVVDRYASVFESKAEKRAREAADGLVEDFARCAEQNGCPHCDTLEAHLHGATLYEAGRALF